MLTSHKYHLALLLSFCECLLFGCHFEKPHPDLTQIEAEAALRNNVKVKRLLSIETITSMQRPKDETSCCSYDVGFSGKVGSQPTKGFADFFWRNGWVLNYVVCDKCPSGIDAEVEDNKPPR